MRILHIAYSDKGGGASKAAYRIHKGLLDRGVDSWFFAGHPLEWGRNVLGPKSFWQKGVRKFHETWDGLPFLGTESQYFRSSGLGGYFPVKVVEDLKPDLIQLHWVGGGVLSLRQLSKLSNTGIPLVWRLPDTWILNGASHFQDDTQHWWDTWIAHRKIQALSGAPLHWVAPSRWMAQQIVSSAFGNRFPIHHIPTGQDLNAFKNRKNAKNELGVLDDCKSYLCIGSDSVKDARKGSKEIKTVFESLKDFFFNQKIGILTFGAGELSLPGMHHRHFGAVDEMKKLSLLYSAADFFLVPSLKDNLPNTVIESLACGTPVLGFDTGAISELIDTHERGALVKTSDVDSLKNLIQNRLLESQTYTEETKEHIRVQCRLKVDPEYSADLQAKKFEDLYLNILRNV